MMTLPRALEAMAKRGEIAEGLISRERPDLIELFWTYQNEAIAAREFLGNSLVTLNYGSEILEVGGGILALSIQLASEGYKVTTVEPVGEGFDGISYIMQTFLEIAKNEDLVFNLVKSPIESCSFNRKFDFIFSINVMEHLSDPYAVLKNLAANLKPGGTYRFFCPNYDFPYEPHFGKILWVRKESSFYVSFDRLIGRAQENLQLEGLYNSINFLTVTKLQKFSRENKFTLDFNSRAFYNLLQRSISDPRLRDRHKKFVPIIILLSKSKLIKFSKIFPVQFQPVMDVTLSN